MKLSPSYISYLLPITLIMGSKFASLFYPYVFTCSIIGLIFILITHTNEPIHNLVRKIFPDLMTYQLIHNKLLYYTANLLIACFKLILLFYYPFNLSFEAKLYIQLFIICIYNLF